MSSMLEIAKRGGKGQETGGRRQETGGRRQETGDRKRETGDRRKGDESQTAVKHFDNQKHPMKDLERLGGKGAGI
jgi:hypothetical protein